MAFANIRRFASVSRAHNLWSIASKRVANQKPRSIAYRILLREHQTRRYHAATTRPAEVLGKQSSLHGCESEHAVLNQVTTSARRATRERQSSLRGRGKSPSKRSHIGADGATCSVTAYCAAEKYDLYAAQILLARHGYHISSHNDDLLSQVLHVQAAFSAAKKSSSKEEGSNDQGDIFVFPSGSVVTWNVPETIASKIVNEILLAVAEHSHLDRIEIEDLRYTEDHSREKSRVIGDTIILGRKPRRAAGDIVSETDYTNDLQGPDSSDEIDTILAKIAFSSALARSAKLAVLEESLDRYFESTRTIIPTLSSGHKLRFTRAFLLRKTGELLNIRAQLNLYSELTDSLPDLFWDSPHELGLETYYETAGRALDINVRIRTLNERLDYAREIAEVLRERLSEKHSTGLEWLIIGLISIEVVFGILHLYNEYTEQTNPRSTRALLTAWLERELAGSHDSIPLD